MASIKTTFIATASGLFEEFHIWLTVTTGFPVAGMISLLNPWNDRSLALIKIIARLTFTRVSVYRLEQTEGYIAPTLYHTMLLSGGPKVRIILFKRKIGGIFFNI